MPLRHPSPDAPRFTAGLLLSSDASRLSAALVGGSGRGFESSLRVERHELLSLPAALAGELRRLIAGQAAPPGLAGGVAAELAGPQAELIARLIASARLPPTELLAVGVHDPGLWCFVDAAPIACQGLCDAARVAELTGLNVIDRFPARDLAEQGLGGPLSALAEWQLLRDRKRTRALIDLGRTLRLTYLPAGRGEMAGRVVSFDVGPGTRLLDRLTETLTRGEQAFDPGGRLAVQGRQIAELRELWLADHYFDRPLPRWHPHGVSAERFLNQAITRALDQRWAVQDVLCTATHFLAESVARALARRVPALPQVEELLVSGGGRNNGMLLHEIAVRCRPIQTLRVDEVPFPGDALDAAAVAVLARFHIEQTPGNLMSVTGAEIPRVLGSLTPGSPAAWQHLLRVMQDVAPPRYSLRSAV